MPILKPHIRDGSPVDRALYYLSRIDKFEGICNEIKQSTEMKRQIPQIKINKEHAQTQRVSDYYSNFPQPKTFLRTMMNEMEECRHNKEGSTDLKTLAEQLSRWTSRQRIKELPLSVQHMFLSLLLASVWDLFPSLATIHISFVCSPHKHFRCPISNNTLIRIWRFRMRCSNYLG